MLMKNNKIKMVKEIGSPILLNQIFNVYDIENGIITFGNNTYGKGVMSFDEFEKHFEIVEEKREWTDWSTLPSYKFKTNYRRVIVKSKDGFEAKATCHLNDKFNLDDGLELCLARINVKRANKKLQDANDELELVKERLY